MKVFESLGTHHHEQVSFCYNPAAGLRAIIAIHDTTLGPALGGTRMWMYPTDDDALRDVLRLSRGMTYKAAVSGLNLGGGKAVIIGDPRKDKNELLFRTFGRYVEGLGGRYITAEDVGMDVTDMEYIRMETKYVTGISHILGGSGDPSPVTALGVFVGMKACMYEKTGNESLRGKTVAVQGAGHVAQYLCEHLAKEGAKIFITDIYEDKVRSVTKTIKAKFVKPEHIYDVRADIFAPCALGGILNDDTIPRLKCSIIAGGANNQLLEQEKHGAMLIKRDILYAPDYAINAGGLINVANELEGYHQARALKQAEGIYTTMLKIFAMSEEKNIPTYVASDRIAEERIASIGGIRKLYAGTSQYSGRFGELSSKVL